MSTAVRMESASTSSAKRTSTEAAASVAPCSESAAVLVIAVCSKLYLHLCTNNMMSACTQNSATMRSSGVTPGTSMELEVARRVVWSAACPARRIRRREHADDDDVVGRDSCLRMVSSGSVKR